MHMAKEQRAEKEEFVGGGVWWFVWGFFGGFFFLSGREIYIWGIYFETFSNHLEYQVWKNVA